MSAHKTGIHSPVEPQIVPPKGKNRATIAVAHSMLIAIYHVLKNNMPLNKKVYEIIWTLHFKIKYSIRFYELVKSIHYHELELYRRKYAVDDLKKLLDGEKYKEYRDFKHRVLVPAVNEINQYSDKTVSFEKIRRGRKVIAIEFAILSKDSLDALKIRSDIEKEFGLDQMTLWDGLEEKGLI